MISHTDITWRKRVEAVIVDREAVLRPRHERIRDLAGRPITAQEEERARIARELRDDISQRLAALAVALSRLRQRTPASTHDPMEPPEMLHARPAELSNDVCDFSRELHPAMLEHAGVATAIHGFCEEFSAQAELDIDFSVAGHPDDYRACLGADTALCLYRVVQEALRNVAAHSGAQGARVDLRRAGDAIRLSISDTARASSLRPRAGMAG